MINIKKYLLLLLLVCATRGIYRKYNHKDARNSILLRHLRGHECDTMMEINALDGTPMYKGRIGREVVSCLKQKGLVSKRCLNMLQLMLLDDIPNVEDYYFVFQGINEEDTMSVVALPLKSN